jgi:hypothetical protein
MADRFLSFDQPPLRDRIADRTLRMSRTWAQWFTRLIPTLDSIPNRLNTVSLTEQGAAISATDFSNYVLLPGLYFLSYYARITTVGGVSSSLTVTLGWTDGGVAQSYSGSAMTANKTFTNQSGSVMVHVDSGSSVTYSTAYASAGSPSMEYRLDAAIFKVKPE